MVTGHDESAEIVLFDMLCPLERQCCMSSLMIFVHHGRARGAAFPPVVLVPSVGKVCSHG
jgi:hypothetical protein